MELPRQLPFRLRQICGLLSLGCSTTEICQILRIKKETVKFYINRIFRRTGVSSRLQLILLVHETYLEAKEATQELMRKD